MGTEQKIELRNRVFSSLSPEALEKFVEFLEVGLQNDYRESLPVAHLSESAHWQESDKGSSKPVSRVLYSYLSER